MSIIQKELPYQGIAGCDSSDAHPDIFHTTARTYGTYVPLQIPMTDGLDDHAPDTRNSTLVIVSRSFRAASTDPGEIQYNQRIDVTNRP